MDIKLLIVNYHYIRKSPPLRGIYGITPDDFEKQLEAIHHHGFNLISLEDLHVAIRNKDPDKLHNKSCLITFDDGLRESYESGLSILDRKGIPGAFYISSSTIDRQIVLDVHKLHYIQSAMNDFEILDHLPSHFFSRLKTVAEETIKDQYIWDELATAKVKYLINFLLNPSERAEVVRKLFSICISSEREFSESLYMTKEQIKDIANRNSLGSHGVSHLPFASLSPSELDYEIAESRTALKGLTGRNVEAVSYPYGGASAISREVFDVSIKNNLISGMTMMRGLNTEIEILGSPLQLKRFDTNDVFGGKSEVMYKGCFND